MGYVLQFGKTEHKKYISFSVLLLLYKHSVQLSFPDQQTSTSWSMGSTRIKHGVSPLCKKKKNCGWMSGWEPFVHFSSFNAHRKVPPSPPPAQTTPTSQTDFQSTSNESKGAVVAKLMKEHPHICTQKVQGFLFCFGTVQRILDKNFTAWSWLQNGYPMTWSTKCCVNDAHDLLSHFEPDGPKHALIVTAGDKTWVPF